ncbi:hypothetical protein [Azotobacter armeniacus]
MRLPCHTLVAKYGTYKVCKVEVIGHLVPLVEALAPWLFRFKAVMAWAGLQLQGKGGKRSNNMIVLPAEGLCLGAGVSAAELRCSAILPEEGLAILRQFVQLIQHTLPRVFANRKFVGAGAA